MQIKSIDGALHQVAPSEVERLYKMLPGKKSQHMDQAEDMAMIDVILQRIQHKLEKKLHASAHNIKRLMHWDHVPETCDDIKTALAKAVMQSPPWDLSAMIYEAARFEPIMIMHEIVTEELERD